MPLDRELRRLDAAHHGRRPAQADRFGPRAPKRSLQVLDVLVAEPEQRDLPVAHDPLGIDDEDRAAHDAPGAEDAVSANACSLGIGEQRHGESVLGAEALVGVERLRGHADHIRVELVQPVGRIAVGAELPGAHRGEVAGIEGEHEPASPEVGEPDGAAAGPAKLEVRGAVADLDPRHALALLTVIVRITTVAQRRAGVAAGRIAELAIRSTTSSPELTFPSSA